MPKRKESKDFDTIHLVIPKEWKSKIKELARRKGYMSVSEYIRDLLRSELEQEREDVKR